MVSAMARWPLGLLLLAAKCIAARPNVIWIMADDLGWGEVGLYPAASPHGRIATPNLDRFGEEGLVFWQAYAGYTVCAPSRTAFFTGRHSGRFRDLGLNGQVLQPGQANLTLVPELFREAGYRTGAFGKVAPLTSPLEQGFEVFVGQVDQALCHNMYPKKIDSGHEQLSFELSANMHSPAPSRERCMANPKGYNYTIDVFHDQAMAWMEEVAKASTAFFLYLSYTVPHAGGWDDAPSSPEEGNPVPSDMAYGNQSWPDVEKDHAAVISYLDAKVGDLLARLTSLQIDETTLVFFASDNGAHREGGHDVAFFNSTGGLAGHKRSLFEGGVRSPSMVRWPGTVKPGRSELPWAFWDVLPTVEELLGLPFSASDGISILPELYGKSQKQHDYLYFTWIGAGGALCEQRRRLPGYSVRSGRWKGLVPHCADQNLRPSQADAMWLYDLQEDPMEKREVSAEHPDIVKKLKDIVISQQLSCMCYQCNFVNETPFPCENDQEVQEVQEVKEVTVEVTV